MVGADVLRFCGEVLNDTSRVTEINETVAVLIPKVYVPQNMSQYRPISLFRVIYKIFEGTCQ